MTGVPGDVDDTELVEHLSASYLASGLGAMSAESAFSAALDRTARQS